MGRGEGSVDMRIVETEREDTEAMEVEKSRCKLGKRDSRLICIFFSSLTNDSSCSGEKAAKS